MCEIAPMNWADLRFVLAIARGRTLSQAASELGATHTTVGRRLRALEDGLGVRLFDQTPDGFLPTPAGTDVIEVLERVEGELLAMEARVVGGDVRLSGKLRVTTMDMLHRRYASAFCDFVERHPDVELTLNCSDGESSLTRREADVALRMSNTPPELLVGRKVGRVDFAVFASKSLVARVGDGAPYSAFPWLHWDERLDARWLDAWLAENVPQVRISARVDAGSLALREMVASGLGVHFLASFEGDADPRLARIGPIDSTFSRDVWLLTLPELRAATRVRAFMDHMHAALTTAA